MLAWNIRIIQLFTEHSKTGQLKQITQSLNEDSVLFTKFWNFKTAVPSLSYDVPTNNVVFFQNYIFNLGWVD